jgi:glycosyltransferase involved in cell wall biosynthesis
VTAPLLLSVFATFAVGGPQMRFARLANHFGERYRHAIVAMDGRREAAARLDPALAVSYPELAIRKGDALGNRRRFRAALRTLEPAVLVTNNWGSIEWAAANWPRLVRHVHIEDGFGPEEATAQLPRRVWARRLLLRRSTVVLPSRTLFAIATERWRLPPARLRYLPNGIDLARFRPEGPAAPQPAGAGPLIGTVAALRAEKNLARLLRAAALLAAEAIPFRLLIVGDGPERSALEALAGALGLGPRVTFQGHVADPAATYRAFDVFALTSDTEQMPLSLLEAMASGLPVAATEVGDVRAMLAAENHAQLAERSDAGVAAALRPLLADASLRARLGAANRAKAERDYDEQAMFRAYAALFDGA